MLPNDWDAVLGDALHTPGWSELTEFVDQERKAGQVYPAAEKVFRAFELTPYARVRCHPGPGAVPRRGAGARSRLLGRAGEAPTIAAQDPEGARRGP
jgi:hypothetical protein